MVLTFFYYVGSLYLIIFLIFFYSSSRVNAPLRLLLHVPSEIESFGFVTFFTSFFLFNGYIYIYIYMNYVVVLDSCDDHWRPSLYWRINVCSLRLFLHVPSLMESFMHHLLNGLLPFRRCCCLRLFLVVFDSLYGN